jgi:hypothetical protein
MLTFVSFRLISELLNWRSSDIIIHMSNRNSKSLDILLDGPEKDILRPGYFCAPMYYSLISIYISGSLVERPWERGWVWSCNSFAHTNQFIWNLWQIMCVWANELIEYFRNTSIATTVIWAQGRWVGPQSNKGP